VIHDILIDIRATIWPIIGLILFLLAFIGIIYWTYRGKRDRFKYESRLPLDDGTTTHDNHEDSHEDNITEPHGTRP